MSLVEARAEFERQHEGRYLKRHRMRGTYLSAPIAALWNQHLRTIQWITGRNLKEEDMKRGIK
jgi:hypothetical protein